MFFCLLLIGPVELCRYPPNQKGLEDPKTNSGYKTRVYCSAQANWRRPVLSEITRENDVLFENYRSLPCGVIDSQNMTRECHADCNRLTPGTTAPCVFARNVHPVHWLMVRREVSSITCPFIYLSWPPARPRHVWGRIDKWRTVVIIYL